MAGAAAARDAGGGGRGWAFAMDVDPFADGPLDLRGMNEKVAGGSGFIRLAPDGESYVRGDGEPIRLWGVAANCTLKTTDEELARHARFLARMGCNAVRMGGASAGLAPQAEGSRLEEPDRGFVDIVWRVVAAMKKEGIYTRISPFWDHGSVKYINPAWGLEGYKSGDGLNGLLFFEPALQKAYRNWMRVLMTEPNPYTGIPLRDDPAVALVQIVSEDSLLFFFTDRIKGGPRRELERRFGAFAKAKHGSVEGALEAWGGAREGDAPAEQRLAVARVHEMATGPGKRMEAQVEFLAGLERAFYEETVRFLRGELGVKSLITSSNFGPAFPEQLGAAQRWAWAGADVIEFNSFFNVPHEGKNKAWRIDPGDFYAPRSAFRDGDIPCLRKLTAGRAFNMSSTTWLLPNPYTVEGAPLLAAYGAMAGVDGIFHFSATAPVYLDPPVMAFLKLEGGHPMHRWTLSHPGYLAQFPAAALIFRLGLIAPADVVVREEFGRSEMFERRPPLLAEGMGYSPEGNEGSGAPPAGGGAGPAPFARLGAKEALAGAARPEAFLVGRVEAAYDGNPAKSRVGDIGAYVDAGSGEVRTTHGQLSLNRERGVLRVDAPGAQGAAGFLKAGGGRFALADLTVACSNEYAIVLAVAMDGNPLRDSGRILVQAGTVARLAGWRAEAEEREVRGKKVLGERILSLGMAPWLIERVHASVDLRNSRVSRAFRLDSAGKEAGELTLGRKDGRVRLALPEDSLYVILAGGEG